MAGYATGYLRLLVSTVQPEINASTFVFDCNGHSLGFLWQSFCWLWPSEVHKIPPTLRFDDRALIWVHGEIIFHEQPFLGLRVRAEVLMFRRELAG